MPYQTFATSDGHIILTVSNDTQFQNFCEVAGIPELAQDERYTTNKERVINRDHLIPDLERVMIKKPSEFWLKALEKEGVPCGPINNMEQVFADPHVQHRTMEITLPHRETGEVRLLSNPVRFDNTPLNADSPPPRLGEHTRAVLDTLLPDSKEKLDLLQKNRIIAWPHMVENCSTKK